MQAKWVHVHPLPANAQDWYTTYYGGQGFFTAGDGIDAAMQQGSLVDSILAAGIPASISTYLLSGNQNDVPNMHNEHTGPSDGVVFVQSAAAVQGIGRVAGNAAQSFGAIMGRSSSEPDRSVAEAVKPAYAI